MTGTGKKTASNENENQMTTLTWSWCWLAAGDSMLPTEEEEEGSRRDWPAEDDIQTAWLTGTPESVIRCSYS